MRCGPGGPREGGWFLGGRGPGLGSQFCHGSELPPWVSISPSMRWASNASSDLLGACDEEQCRLCVGRGPFSSPERPPEADSPVPPLQRPLPSLTRSSLPSSLLPSHRSGSWPPLSSAWALQATLPLTGDHGSARGKHSFHSSRSTANPAA